MPEPDFLRYVRSKGLDNPTNVSPFGLRVGDKVRLRKLPCDAKAETATVVHIPNGPNNNMIVVEVDEEFLQGPDDDGLREDVDYEMEKLNAHTKTQKTADPS